MNNVKHRAELAVEFENTSWSDPSGIATLLSGLRATTAQPDMDELRKRGGDARGGARALRAESDFGGARQYF